MREEQREGKKRGEGVGDKGREEEREERGSDGAYHEVLQTGVVVHVAVPSGSPTWQLGRCASQGRASLLVTCQLHHSCFPTQAVRVCHSSFPLTCHTRPFCPSLALSRLILPSYRPNHSLTHSLTHSFTHSLTHALTHSLNHSLTHSLTHRRTHSLTHALTYSLTHDE